MGEGGGRGGGGMMRFKVQGGPDGRNRGQLLQLPAFLGLRTTILESKVQTAAKLMVVFRGQAGNWGSAILQLILAMISL